MKLSDLPPFLKPETVYQRIKDLSDTSPGIYIWVNAETGDVLYVGESVSLCERLTPDHKEAGYKVLYHNIRYEIHTPTTPFIGLEEPRLKPALKGLERYMIQILEPQWNKQQNKTKPQVCDETHQPLTEVCGDLVEALQLKLSEYDCGYQLYASQLKQRIKLQCPDDQLLGTLSHLASLRLIDLEGSKITVLDPQGSYSEFSKRLGSIPEGKSCYITKLRERFTKLDDETFQSYLVKYCSLGNGFVDGKIFTKQTSDLKIG